MRLLVTGGCGFIGSNFIRHVFETRGDGVFVVNLDKLTYAANPANLADVADRDNYRFTRGDIADPEAVRSAMEGCTHVVNFAAETHVDRSLLGDASFIETDVRGVFVLLEEAKRRGVPAFRIFTDATLQAIADKRPATAAELLAVPGIGMATVQQYGAQLYRLLHGK